MTVFMIKRKKTVLSNAPSHFVSFQKDTYSYYKLNEHQYKLKFWISVAFKGKLNSTLLKS